MQNSLYWPMQIFILLNEPTKAILTFRDVGTWFDMTTIIRFRWDSILIIFLHYRRQEKSWIDQIFCSTTEVAEAALRITADVPTSQIRKFIVYAAALMWAVYHSPWGYVCNIFGCKMEPIWLNMWEIDLRVSKWWCQGPLNIMRAPWDVK